MSRASQGAALLDRDVPYWALRIDLDRLRLSSARRCVLAQVYGDFNRGRRRLGLWATWDTRNVGFACYTPWGYLRVEREWRQLVADRQKFSAVSSLVVDGHKNIIPIRHLVDAGA